MLILNIVKLDSDGNDVKVLKTIAVAAAMSIGRHTTADIRIDDKSISRLHCFVIPSPDGGQLKVKDLNSESGTIVDEGKISEAALSKGMAFFLGKAYRIEIKEGKGRVKYKETRTMEEV
jgi:pSer/pThr/pTyr-binding forkhead associated (FHA) protein